MDLLKLLIGCAIITLVLFAVGQSKANAEDDSPMGLTQHLYEQAISEIEQGNKDLGCLILRDALLASHDVDDDFETYKTIWAIGTQACNWINNPSTIETSN